MIRPSNLGYYNLFFDRVGNSYMFQIQKSSIRCAPHSKSDLFAGTSKVKRGLPHSDICCANCSVLLPSEAWAIHILSASAVTNALRWFANAAVDRRCLLSKVDRSNRRSAANASFHAGFSRMFSTLRAGHRIIGCEPRSRTRRHSCSTGEWYPPMVGVLDSRNC